jgi:large subunit ribosomal protein L20
MPRVTKSVTAKAKHKKVLSATKGHYGARSRLYKTAKQSNIKSLQYAFRDRKNRKRSFRALWISRINAGARDIGVSYSRLIDGLTKKDIAIDRKILSDLAISDSSTFEKIVQTAVK